MKEFYLLSLKWSRAKDRYVWWGQDNGGYVEDLNQAGLYTEETINSMPRYYKNTRVVPVLKEVAENLFIQKVVPATSANWNAMNIDITTLKEY
ncbi:hypothetical protein [Brevibacillus sp. DP1.3A]|uniref:hypothetical protein n=1 Tax=Brevibacillus sp. DP1.3A TaxID=2738867 RepID=UPI00156AD8A7|nr:hypothetical protein [Brevibacillus sp. DP1.3A]UED77485.1 hypothetical protein HP399_013795 [Brevibacillus sp. DP1.3A]